MKNPTTPTIILDSKFETLVSIDFICQVLKIRPIDLDFIIRDFKQYIRTEETQDNSQPSQPGAALFIPSYILNDFLQRIPTQNLSTQNREILIAARENLLAVIDTMRWDVTTRLYAEQGILAQREREAYEKIARGAIQIHHKALSCRGEQRPNFLSEKTLITASTDELKEVLAIIANDLSTHEIQRLYRPGKHSCICAWLELKKEGEAIVEKLFYTFMTEHMIDIYEEMPKEYRRKIYNEDGPTLN